MKANILIVDDIQSNLDTLNFMIDDIEFEDGISVNVIKAKSGNEALNLATKYNLALIILDIQMPEMDGFEVARFLKKSIKTKDVPIMFLTAAYKSEEMRNYGLRVGAFDYFLKPIDPLLLVPKIKLYIHFYLLNSKLKDSNAILEEKIKEAIEKNSQIESKLYQAERLASIGEMIGNIAHQWRQPLAIISMWANNIVADVDMEEVENENLRKYSNNIVEQTKRLSQTIEDFRGFFAPNKEKNKFLLEKSIEKIITLLSASFKAHNIEIIKDIEDIQITALENELIQSILNIMKNAKDVLLTLAKDKKRLIFIKTYQKQNIAVIEIKDSGEGISEEIIKKIFEPYFTTKHKFQGTGVGLYMVESIVTKHLGGKISVQNLEYEYEDKKYKGAKFIIEIPTGNKQ